MFHDTTNAIFSTDKKNTKQDTSTVLYTTKDYSKNTDDLGNFILNQDSELVFAKKMYLQNRWKFFARLDINNFLYNPYTMYNHYKSKNDLFKPDSDKKNFKEINHKNFELYLMFLKTGNMSLYNNINRELI